MTAKLFVPAGGLLQESAGETLPPLLDDAPPDVPRTPNAHRRFLQLHFLDHTPDHGWAEGYAKYCDQLNASGIANHLWTSPFIQTVVGTDTYTDQLW